MNKNDVMNLITNCDSVVEESHKYVAAAMDSVMQKNDKVDAVKSIIQQQQEE